MTTLNPRRSDPQEMSTRRSSEKRMSERAYLLLLLIFAPLTWGGLVLFTGYVPPQSVLAILIFFILLTPALLCTLIPLIYILTRLLAARFYQLDLRLAFRQGALLSIWIIFNLTLRLLNSGNLFTAVVSFGIVIVIEILALGRKSPPRR